MTREEHAKRLRNECDNYDQTVQAIKALAHELLWDDTTRAVREGGAIYVGRRMDTSKSNRVSPDNQVTPDLVVRLTGQDNIVAEAKLALPKDPEWREPKILDLLKYDDDLLGWDTRSKKVARHDVAMIIHHFHSIEVKDQIVALRTAQKLRFERQFALISYALVDEAQVWMMLQLADGALTNVGKAEKLRAIVKIKMEHVATNPRLASVELYDACAPMPRMMDLIHKEIFGRLQREALIELQETNETRAMIDVAILREQLSESVGPGQTGERVPEIPRREWVKDAMEMFVNIGWARRLDGEHGVYNYCVKKRRDPFGQFISKCAAECVEREKGPTENAGVYHKGVGPQTRLFDF